MRKKRKLLKTLLCLLLCAALLPISALADSSTPLSFSDDTDNELLFDSHPKQTRPLLKSPAPLSGKTLSCAGFISTVSQREYIDRMIQWYLDEYPALRNTLASGSSVIMFFEGGSDNTQNSSYTDLGYRDGALGLVLRQEAGQTYIADYCENCSTLPDFPLGYEYDNGHPDYGSATLMDGVYNIFNVNHRGYYFALNTAAPGHLNSSPCIYMRNDGAFAQLNGTGINVHTRMRDHVGDSVLSPVSAGCLTVGDSSSLDEYNRFMSAFNGGRFSLDSAVFNEADTYKYTVSDFQSFGMIVVDRYLARDRMLNIYGNQEAVDAITRHSLLAQKDPDHILSGFTEYPSYLALTLTAPVTLKSLPTAAAADLSAASTATATALYASGTDLWYQVQMASGVGFLPASAVTSVTALYDDISIHNTNYPVEKPQYASFSVTGILGSAYNRFTTVSGHILSASGEQESSCTSAVNTHSYSLNAADAGTSYAESIDYNLAFGGLSLGNHRYQVTGTVRNYYADGGQVKYKEKTFTFVDQPFTVVPLSILKEGTDTVWLRDSETGLTVHSNAIASWINGVSVDGTAVPPAEYTLTDNVLVTLTPAYLQTLQNGSHTLTLQTAKGVTLQSKFTVGSPYLPIISLLKTVRCFILQISLLLLLLRLSPWHILR